MLLTAPLLKIYLECDRDTFMNGTATVFKNHFYE